MSYSTEVELTAYATARGITLNTDLEILLTKAHDFIESKSYKGSRYSSQQLTMWPRSGVYIDGVLIPADVVPKGIKNAEMQAAIEIDAGLDPLANVERATKREKVDVIEIEYMDSSSDTTRLTKVMALLRPYIKSNHGLVRA